MSATPRSDAMKPSRPGPTRTAPGRPPDHFPSKGRYPSYLAFGSCGIFLLLSGLLVLRAVWALGSGSPEAWRDLLDDFAHPLYVIYHLIALAALVWFALRLIRLFPKTQPPRFGPLRRPPDAVFAAVLNGAFAVVSLLAILVLWGVVP